MKSIKLTNKTNNDVIETTTSNKSTTMYSIPFGQYSLLITEDGFDDYTEDLVIDNATEIFDIVMVAQEGTTPEPSDTVVFQSNLQPVKFTANATNAYLSSWEVKLEANTDYYLETNYPGDLWVTNSLYIPTQTKMTSNKSPIVTTIGGGNFGVVGRPQKDGDGTTYSTNVTQFEDNTYYFVIKRVD